jgi:hypothetical protein
VSTSTLTIEEHVAWIIAYTWAGDVFALNASPPEQPSTFGASEGVRHRLRATIASNIRAHALILGAALPEEILKRKTAWSPGAEAAGPFPDGPGGVQPFKP